MSDSKVFTVIFNERQSKTSSRKQHRSKQEKKNHDDYEIIVPPSMRKNQKPVTYSTDAQESRMELPEKKIGSDSFLHDYQAKAEQELREEASSSSLDTDIIQPSCRTHIQLKSVARAPSSLRSLEGTRTLQSRLPVHGKERTGMAPSDHDRTTHSYLDRSPDFLSLIRREVKQIVCETKSSKEHVHTLRKQEINKEGNDTDKKERIDENEIPSKPEVRKKEDEIVNTVDDVRKCWWSCW